jgi:cellulose biosynthesis protein BcsQ
LATQLAGAGVYVVDTPPQLGAILDAAVGVADRVLLPTRLGQQDIDSLLDTLERAPAALVVANAVPRGPRIL